MTEMIILVIKTIVTTLDILLCGIVVGHDKSGNRRMQLWVCMFVLLNLAGIWL